MADPLITGASAAEASVTCIVVHGRGQSQQDMMDIVVDRIAVAGIRYVLPKSDGPGWYAARAIDPLNDATRNELDHGLQQLAAVITAQRDAAPQKPVLLCGFSQGACLSAELVLRDLAPVQAACLFTACRVGTLQDHLPIAQQQGLPVYASCSDNDPWIPAPAHYQMLGDLTRAGARLRCDMFPGRAHMVANTEIAVLADMLQALAAGHAIWGAGE